MTIPAVTEIYNGFRNYSVISLMLTKFVHSLFISIKIKIYKPDREIIMKVEVLFLNDVKVINILVEKHILPYCCAMML